ncbi:cobalt-precorrin-6A reductase [Pelosinus sp. sgz500959]|uniref:cobalt-precorrin-6A reductase n=1 Tax=Pelosinus sp. sgz500959 TaxID=3242472 RepID=UPI00366AA138
MILVLAGTKDGRDLIALLAKAGYQVMASAFSQYGGELIQLENVCVHTGPLDEHGLAELITRNGIEIMVDASHPYAVNVSQNGMLACEKTGTQYIRYERPRAAMPSYEGLHVVTDYQQAIEKVAVLGKSIFLTTGSRHLKLFKDAACLAHHRIIARVLPEPSVLTECIDLGFSPKDIIAIQGPFSHELNMALFKEYEADVIVTKNSGQVGGSDTKITAAMALGLPLVVIDRPTIHYRKIVYAIEDVIKFIKEAQ